jgi:hypothetical protein
MFDYQAGEKFKLTLIMVGFAGLMAGMLFTMLLMPSQESPRHRKAHHINWSANAEGSRSTGRHSVVDGQQAAPASASASDPAPASASAPAAAPEPPVTMVDASEAANLITSWLPLAWDLSAGSARGSQEKALMYMTPDCAAAYRQNVWTPDVAKTIEDAGLQSSFTADKIIPGQPQSDGSIVVFVEGTQVMSVPGKGTQQKPKRLEYLIKSTQEGLRVAGISEAGQQS